GREGFEMARLWRLPELDDYIDAAIAMRGKGGQIGSEFTPFGNRGCSRPHQKQNGKEQSIRSYAPLAAVPGLTPKCSLPNDHSPILHELIRGASGHLTSCGPRSPTPPKQ